MHKITVRPFGTSDDRIKSGKFVTVRPDLEKALEERTVKPFAQKKNPRRQTGVCS